MNDVLIVVDMQNDFIDGALGTAEALAHGSLPVWGFQWHPERLGHGRPPGTVDGELVFDFFLAQCRRRLPLWRR